MSDDDREPFKIASRRDRQAFWREVMNDRHAETPHRFKARELLRASTPTIGPPSERGETR